MVDRKYTISSNALMFLLVAFTFVGSILLASREIGFVFGDVFLYEEWAGSVSSSNILGFNTSWVYPYFAIVPMLLANVVTYVSGSYLASWFLLIFVLYLVALFSFKNSFPDFKWKPYVLFSLSTLMLFGLYLGRLDGVAIAVTIIAISLFKKHKNLAIVLLSIGLWIKIWPVAFLLAFFIIDSKKLKFAITAVVTNVAIVILPLVFGGSLVNVLGFLGSQGGRSIQMESVYGLPWLAGLGETYFDKELITWQVSGSGVEFASTFSNYLLIIALAVVVVLGFFIGKKMVNNFEFAIIFGSLVMAVLIFFNKVGSPQFMGWMIIPVMYLSQIDFKKYRVLIFSAIVAMFATGLSAPVFFINIINQDFVGILMICFKYLGVLVFIAGCVYFLSKERKAQIFKGAHNLEK